jgi:signal transduction histidine kinase
VRSRGGSGEGKRSGGVASRKLASEASEWREAFDAIEIPIIICSPEATVLRINRAARLLAGRTAQEILEHPIDALGSPWLVVRELIRTARSSNAPAITNVTDHVGRTWDVVVTPFTADLGERYVITAWDLTSMMEMQLMLHQNDAMVAMGALVGGVAHEVRNPLFAISAVVDALEVAADGAHREYFDALREEVDRMNHLMHDLLAYGKPAAAQRVRCEVGPVIRRACNSSAVSAKKRNVTLDVRIEDGETILLIDADRMAQAIQNIVENAILHAPSASTVTVNALRDDAGDGYLIHVMDEGKGFAEEDLHRVFEPFYSKRKGGTGLGLAIVAQVVREHGGHVWVKNRETGGAEVSMRLPFPPAQ